MLRGKLGADAQPELGEPQARQNLSAAQRQRSASSQAAAQQIASCSKAGARPQNEAPLGRNQHAIAATRRRK